MANLDRPRPRKIVVSRFGQIEYDYGSDYYKQDITVMMGLSMLSGARDQNNNLRLRSLIERARETNTYERTPD